MKHYILLLMLLLAPVISNSQNTKLDKLPDELNGEWYDKEGHRENNGILIRPDFIEYFYQACPYVQIEKSDSAYEVKAFLPSGSDTVRFSIQPVTKDTIKVIRPGGDVVVYGKVDCPLNATRIQPDDFPKEFRKKWFTTNGENSVEFDITGDKLLFRGTSYTIDDVIMISDRSGLQYRVVAVSDNAPPMMFYFKNRTNGYCQVGFFGKYGDLYKTSLDYPDVRFDNPEQFVKDVKGNWYTTDGKDKTGFAFVNGNVTIDAKKYKLNKLEKRNDSYFLYVSRNKMMIPLMVRKETDNYIRFSENNGSAKLLKHNKTDKNYLTLKLPGELKGDWYSTDGKNTKCITLSDNEVVLCGKKTQNAVIGKTTNGIGILNNKEKIVAVVTLKTDSHIEMLDKKGNRNIYKRTPGTDDIFHLTSDMLPDNIKGNWFGTDGNEYWAFGLTNDFFVTENAFWNYLDITYKDNLYTIVTENDNGVNTYTFKTIDNLTCEVSKNNDTFKTYTKNKDKAVSRPQNKFASRKTKDVFIQGYCTGEKKDRPSTINFLVNSIVFDTQVTYPAKTDKQGRFSVTFPKIYTQDVFIKANNSFNGLMLSPGDSITICIGSDNSIDFMGDNADACYDMTKYLDYNRSNIYPFINFDEERKHQKEDTFFVYKEYKLKQYEKRTKWTNDYLARNEVSINFKKWLNDDLRYYLPNELMRYRWLHSGRRYVEMPDSCFSFINDYPVDLNTDLISSNFQSYCHELYMYYNNKMSRDTTMKVRLDGKAIVEFLTEKKVETPDSIRILLDKLLEGKIKDKKDIESVNAFIRKHSSLLNELALSRLLEMQKEYFKKNDMPSVFQLSLSTSLYGLIENSDTITLKNQVPKYLSEITNPDFRNLLQAKYEEQLESARNPFVIEDAILNSENPSSGDSLLVSIVNKHKGKVIYVDFWATWCGPCRGEMPYSLKIQEKMKGKDVVFVYLCSDSSPEMKWKELINKLEITGDHYYVNRSAWSDLTGRFGISGIPHYILIDKDGKVVNTAAKRPSQGDLLIKDMEELLKK